MLIRPPADERSRRSARIRPPRGDRPRSRDAVGPAVRAVVGGHHRRRRRRGGWATCSPSSSTTRCCSTTRCTTASRPGATARATGSARRLTELPGRRARSADVAVPDPVEPAARRPRRAGSGSPRRCSASPPSPSSGSSARRLGRALQSGLVAAGDRRRLPEPVDQRLAGDVRVAGLPAGRRRPARRPRLRPAARGRAGPSPSGCWPGSAALARSEIALFAVGFAVLAWWRAAGHPAGR